MRKPYSPRLSGQIVVRPHFLLVVLNNSDNTFLLNVVEEGTLIAEGCEDIAEVFLLKDVDGMNNIGVL
jgi:hypothetical protein